MVNGQVADESAQEARYQVVVYHHFENGFDEKLDYQALAEAERAAQGYVDGTLEADGFAYDGAAIYDLQEKQYLRVFGDYPDDAAIAATQPVQETTPIETTAELDLTDTDLQDVLTGDGGLLDYLDKDKIGGWFRDGDDNAAIAQKLGDAYAGTAETMALLSGETADYFVSANGLAINIHDKFNTNLSFGWNEIAPVLRAMYEQERDGFSHKPTLKIAKDGASLLLARAHELIDSFCQSEYGSTGNDDDLTKIGAAYTTVTDDEIPIQVNINLVDFRLERYPDDVLIESQQYASLQDFIDNELGNLNFSDLISVTDEEIARSEHTQPERPAFPYAVGDTVYLEDGKAFIITEVTDTSVQLQDPTFYYPIFRAESRESFTRLMERFPQPEEQAPDIK